MTKPQLPSLLMCAKKTSQAAHCIKSLAQMAQLCQFGFGSNDGVLNIEYFDNLYCFCKNNEAVVRK